MSYFLHNAVAWYAIISILIGYLIKRRLKRYWYNAATKPRPSFDKFDFDKTLTFWLILIYRLFMLFGIFLLLIVWYNKP